MIRFRCSCGRMLQARDEDVGESARCPVCATVMLVPTEGEALRQSVATSRPEQAESGRQAGRGWREVDDREYQRRRGPEKLRDDRREPEPERTSRKAR